MTELKKTAHLSLPRHIAIVMDGNGRWARRRHLPRLAGHKAGVKALRAVVEHCARLGVEVLTVFAFSSENWGRPAEEVRGLMSLLSQALLKEVPSLSEANIRLCFVGDLSPLSSSLKEAMEQAQRQTASHKGMILNVCVNYGGRWDIARAARTLVAKGVELSEENLHAATALAHVGDPDLIIRTGDEMRISNFLLWQAAYAELYFSAVLWPDFDARALEEAIVDYGLRERRFGKTSEQVIRSASESAA